MTGFYLSWTDRKNRAADTTVDTIHSLPMATAMASNLQRLNGYSRVDVVAVDEEEVVATVDAKGIHLSNVDATDAAEILYR